AADVKLDDGTCTWHDDADRVAFALTILIEHAFPRAKRRHVLADAALDLGEGRAPRSHFERETSKGVARVGSVRAHLLQPDRQAIGVELLLRGVDHRAEARLEVIARTGGDVLRRRELLLLQRELFLEARQPLLEPRALLLVGARLVFV